MRAFFVHVAPVGIRGLVLRPLVHLFTYLSYWVEYVYMC